MHTQESQQNPSRTPTKGFPPNTPLSTWQMTTPEREPGKQQEESNSLCTKESRKIKKYISKNNIKY